MVRYRVVGSDPLEWGITQEEFTKYVAKVRRDALLEAAKAVCEYCRKEVKFVTWNNKLHHKTNYSMILCYADSIHKLLAEGQSQSQGQGQGKE